MARPILPFYAHNAVTWFNIFSITVAVRPKFSTSLILQPIKHKMLSKWNNESLGGRSVPHKTPTYTGKQSTRGRSLISVHALKEQYILFLVVCIYIATLNQCLENVCNKMKTVLPPDNNRRQIIIPRTVRKQHSNTS
jgi:hypothetical protein